MQISLRSHLIAGVAAVGATAMVISPIAQPDLLPSVQRVSSAVQLTSFDNPVSVLLATLADTSASIFDQTPLLDPAKLFWPDSFYTPNFSTVFAPGYYGLIPDFANQFSFGGLSAVLANLSGYVNAGIQGATGLLGGPIAAVTNVPFALATAAGYLAAGQPELAIAELQAQILGPLQQGIATGLAAAGYIIDNVISNVSTLISNTIPGLVGNLIATISNGALTVGQGLVTTLSSAVAALAAAQFETAWNTVVNGLLGVDGTLGQLKNLTIGIGITQVLTYPDEGDVLTVTVPSFRSDFTTAGQRLGDLSSYGDGGIRNDAFTPPLLTVTPPAAALSAPQASAAKVARPAAVASDSAATDKSTGKSKASVSGETSSEAAAPAKAKATRGHARGANAGD